MRYITVIFLLTLFNTSVMSATVLVIESYHDEYPWVTSYRKGLQSSIGIEHELQFFQMDTKRVRKTFFASRAEQAWTAFQKASPDVVVIADDNALETLAQKLNTIETNIIYLGINGNPRQYGLDISILDGGVFERPEIRASFSRLKNVMTLKKVLFLTEQSTTSSNILKYMLNDKTASKVAGVEYDFVSTKDFFEWKTQILSAKRNEYDAVFIGLYQALVDDAGASIPGRKVIEWTSLHSVVPPFALYDYAVGSDKLVGGLVISGYTQGFEAGTLTNQLLDGLDTSYFPKRGKNGLLLFSKAQWDKWELGATPSFKSQIEWTD